jgi:ATP-dependent DNA helicase RecG
VIERMRAACAEGRQAYWVCTLIEESDEAGGAGRAEPRREARRALPELRVGLVHGRMKAARKEATMAAFKAGETRPAGGDHGDRGRRGRAQRQLMIIENAERLGLAQLHQLRGRVGRGSAASELRAAVPAAAVADGARSAWK